MNAIHAYMRSVNSDVVQTRLGTFAPGVAKLFKFKPRPMWDDGGNSYWKADAEIVFRYPYNVPPAEAWWPRRRHEGYLAKFPDGIRHAVDAGGDKVSSPVSLKLDGTIEADATIGHFKTFDLPTPLPYGTLGLF